MARSKTFSGTMECIDEPGCEPLHDMVGFELCSWFMQMFDVHLSNGHVVRAFKHRITRSYVYLDRTEPGLAYWYAGTGRYRSADLTAALIAVFRGLWAHEPRDEEAERTWELLELALDRIEQGS